MATNLTAATIPADIQQKLTDVERQTLLTRIQTGLLKTAACLLALLLVSMLVDGSFTLFSTTARFMLTATVLTLTGVAFALKVVKPMLRRDSLDDVAYQVDRSVPALEERWSTILNLSSRQPATTGSSVMLDQVRTEAQSRGALVQPREIIDRQELIQWRNIALGCLVVLGIPFLFAPMQMLILFSRFWLPFADISLVKLDAENKSTIVPVEESLTLSALLREGDAEEATLFINRDGEEERLTLPLITEGVDSPRFLHKIKSVEEPFTYRWRAGDGQTTIYEVNIAERPELEQIKFHLTPPEYTKLSEEQLNHLPPRVRAVKGSRMSVEFRISQPLEEMVLEINNDEELKLTPIAERTFASELELAKSFSFSPHVINEYGLANRKPPLCQVTVYEDRAPAVSIYTPDDEISAPGDDTIDIEFMAKDDFAITRAELVLMKQDPSDPTGTPVSFKTIDIPLDDQQDKSYVNDSTQLDLAELDLKQDDVLSYAVRVYDSKENVSNNESNAEWDPLRPNQSPSAPNDSDSPDSNSVKDGENKTSKSDGENRDGQNQEEDGEGQQQTSANQNASGEDNSSQDNSNQNSGESQKNGAQQQDDATSTEAPDTRDSTAASSKSASESESSPSNGGNSDGKNQQNSESNSGSNSGSGENPQAPQEDTREIRIDRGEDGAPPEGDKSSNSQPDNGQKSLSSGDSSQASGMNVPSTNKQSNSAPSTPMTNDQGEFEPLPFTPDKATGQETAATSPADEEAESGGTPPPNEMGRRMLDMECQSCTSSQQRIVIDEFASRFEGQRRKKYQMAIDPVLKKLKELLTNADKSATAYRETVVSESEPTVSLPQSYKSTAQHLKQSIGAVQELKQKSASTPYAFIGLQVDSIQKQHIDPASNQWAELLKLTEKADKEPAVDKTIFHIERALVLLDQLTRKYENVKRDEEIADKLTRIDKLYQVYLEDSFRMIGSAKPRAHDKNLDPVENEYSEEYLKKLEEILKKRNELFAELAKILAEDPRLLKRFMDSIEDKTTILREKLSEINLLQQRITREGEYWQKYQDRVAEAQKSAKEEGKEEPKEFPFPPPLLERHQQQVYKLAEDAGAIHDKFVTWLPQEVEGQQAVIKELNDRTAQLTLDANQLLKEETQNRAELATKLKESYAAFEKRIGEIYPNVSLEFKEHLNNRVDQVNELERDLEAWIESAEMYEHGDYLGAAEIDQYNLLDEVFEFVSKFQSVETQLNGFPAEIRQIAFDLKQKLQLDVSAAMTESETALHHDDLPKSLEHQRTAHEELVAAEKLFDKMLELMMEELNKAESGGSPDPDDLQFNLTLQELLAMLEREAVAQEKTLLAILRRSGNLQLVTDWLTPQPGGGGGVGGMVSAQLGQQQLNRLQNELLKRAQAQMAASSARKEDWNKLISTLEEGMKQNQGKLTPEQYRAAIEQYFEVLARELAEER